MRVKRSNRKVLPSLCPSPVKGEENADRDCFVAGAPRDDAKGSYFDLKWDDRDIFPTVVYPDAEFLFRRMNEVTLESVNPSEGEIILDVGCGRGIDGVEMAKRGAVVMGLEPSPVMIAHAKEHISENGGSVSLVQGVGEYLPFQAWSLGKVVCKGALDHFFDPAIVIEEIAKVLRPEGKAIIAIANFESLGFKLGKAVWWFRRMLGFKSPEDRMPWEVPPDHTHKFDYSSLKYLVSNRLKVEQATGVSLLFGIPWWGMFLAKCPKGMSLVILNSLDKVARRLPSLSDVVVLKCRPKG